MKKPRVNKVTVIVIDIFLYTFIAICIFTLIIVVVEKRNSDGAVDIFGYELRIVLSSSMEKHENTDTSKFKIKEIKAGSCIFIQKVPQDEGQKEKWFDNLQIGDVLTFKYVYTRQETITHRIVAIEEKEGGFLITLEGDNKSYDSNTLTQVIDTSLLESPNYIIGKVVGQSYLLGLIINVFKSPLGLILTVVVPCIIIIVIQVLRIVNFFNQEKKERLQLAYQKQREEYEKQAREIENLRKLLEQRQKNEETTESNNIESDT